MTIQRLVETELMSKAVIANGMLYASGQMSDDPLPEFEGQVEQLLSKIDAQLLSAGINRTHLVSVTIWIDDYRKWNRLNAVWEKWIVPGSKPARSCVESKLAFPEYQIEMAYIASMTR